jgi:hypothetical protein
MRIKPVGILILFLTLAIAEVAQAQARALSGSWRRISLRDSTAQPLQPPLPPAFLIFSPNGYFSQTAIPAGRPKINKAWEDMTKEELLSQVGNVDAFSGSYELVGTTLTRTIVSALGTFFEGTKFVQAVRFGGDTLILTWPNPANRSEARFLRVR